MTQQSGRINNKKVIGSLLIAFCLIFFALSVIPNFVITNIALGTFGIMWYAILINGLLLGLALALKLKYTYKAKFTVYLAVAIFSFICLMHTIFSTAELSALNGFEDFGKYLSICYHMTNGVSFGGAFIGIFVCLLKTIFGMVGVYAIFIMLLAIFVGVVVDNLIYHKAKINNISAHNKVATFTHELDDSAKQFEDSSLAIDEQVESSSVVEEEPYDLHAETTTFDEEEFQNPTIAKSSRDIARETLFGHNDVPDITLPNDKERDAFMHSYREEHAEKIEEDEQPADNLFGASSITSANHEPSEIYRRNFPTRPVNLSTSRLDDIEDNDSSEEDELNFNEIEEDITPIRSIASRGISRNSSRENIRSLNIDQKLGEDQEEIAKPANINFGLREDPKPQREIRQDKQIGMRSVRYNSIPISLFKEYKETSEDHSEEYHRKSAALEQVMNEFGIAAKVINVVRGPKVTRYEMSLPAGVSTTKVTSIQDNISMALEARSQIRIEAPIPGKNAIGIELENDKTSTVGMRELLESPEFANFKDPLPIAIGKDINGKVIIKSLPKMIHLLVAGSSGSGKSVFIHSVMMSILFKYSPDDIRFVMIDPKRVEFTMYNNLPHLMFPDVLYEHDKALNSLKWTVEEMMRRYDLLKNTECQNIEQYNHIPEVTSKKLPKMPYLVIVVDELAELMSGALKKEFENAIQRITQLGRAAGIHMVVATQRPSVDVVTGTIKNNFATRVAFSLSSSADSKTVLDEGGAESLLGQGDMLFAPQDSNRKIRLQAAFCSNDEIRNAIKYVKENNESVYDEEIKNQVYSVKQETEENEESGSAADHGNGMDELMKKAVIFARANGKVSSSVLQRKFRIGYNRAASIVDQMVEFGWAGPSIGSKPRDFHISDEQFEELFGSADDDDWLV